jgi:hypothetical protein
MVAGCLVGVERVSTTIVCCTAGPMPTARIVRAAPRQANRLSDSILAHFQGYKRYDAPALESPE